MNSLQGRLLVASPGVTDPDLARTVILLIQHSELQAVGVVLNRPTGTTIRQLWKAELKKSCDFEGIVHCGGPVPGPVMALHDHQPLADLEIRPGVYYTVKKKSLPELVHQQGIVLKVFDSHAGWGPGQLEAQIDRGSWQVAATTAEEILAASPPAWERLVAPAENA